MTEYTATIYVTYFTGDIDDARDIAKVMEEALQCTQYRVEVEVARVETV